MRTSSVFWRNFDGETVLFVDKPQPVSSGKRYTMNQFNSASGDRSNCLRSAHSEAVFLIHVLFRILRLKRSQFFCTWRFCH
ncbi:uncharacterized protein [Physcomitrium patens]|uniref:Uncharacterized protein n=1 Tax=Physcomitrium patens TaxID=3218 RepID=A0A7I4APU0_PHYPA|nr:uncharacterized protein LOC112290267 isoform X3 [Physcomitrium patens]|eukprot:XP_024392157.1 uncharacterized protein LOC112290267 isoform X3 [Physcomitrella patens]